MYNWEHQNWPNFTYSVDRVYEISVIFAEEMGLLSGLIMGLNGKLKTEALLETLVAEALKTSEIEGEYMSREDVMSSIKNNLGQSSLMVKDKRTVGLAKLMIDVSQHENRALSTALICNWHKLLMENYNHVKGGVWRAGEEPMQVVSGSYGKEEIHFEAPPSKNVPVEMEKFINWYHDPKLLTRDKISDALLKTAIAHLYFESIHPFEDGNGRIGRALAEYTLSQSLMVSPLFLSLSKTIEKDKKTYYAELKKAQAGLEITSWINYFIKVLLDAQIDAKEVVLFTLKKTKFFDKYFKQFNTRQLKVINKMLENGMEGFEGGITAKKYVSIAKTSKATATRDLQILLELGVLTREGDGRSVSYRLAL